MQNNGGGSIVNVSTFAAYEPDPDFPTSAVLREGLGRFAKLFADRYAADNIRMNNVLPGSSTACPKRRIVSHVFLPGVTAPSASCQRLLLF